MQSEDAKLMIIDEVNEGICVGKFFWCHVKKYWLTTWKMHLRYSTNVCCSSLVVTFFCFVIFY